MSMTMAGERHWAAGSGCGAAANGWEAGAICGAGASAETCGINAGAWAVAAGRITADVWAFA
jgi:hypothetical protein